MLKICLVFWESEPQYVYKRYAYKKKHVIFYRFLGAYEERTIHHHQSSKQHVRTWRPTGWDLQKR